MPMRSPAGFISAFFDPLKNPDAPTSPAATAGNTLATVSFTAPSNVGGSAITQYQAVAFTGSTYVSNTVGTASPISVTGLTNGTAYTFNVWALNSYGPGVWSAASNSVTPVNPRGLFAAGYTNTPPYQTSAISYVTISTTGNATNFGNLTAISNNSSACSSTTRGVFYLGESTNILEYVTIATTGNSSDFGDLTQTASQGTAGGCSNQTRGLFAGSYSTTAEWNVIAYITIATTGNSSDFGDLSIQKGYISSVADTTRAVFGGGIYVSGSAIYTNVIDYVTIATTGNATDFGDMTQNTNQYSSCSNSTRGLFAGGQISAGVTNVVSYITIASTGNATSFGSLSTAKRSLAGCASPTRGIFGGGTNSAGAVINVIDYFTINTTGNSTNFGSLVTDQSALASCSNCHGGL